jgi:predicted Zn-dependent peptidase
MAFPPMPHQNFTLKNGMRVHLVPVTGTQAVTVLVLTKVGSRYETPTLSGASHFIEHLMFKGTKRRPTTLDISRALDSVGAQYNAYTNKHETGYYIKIDAKHTNLAVDMLHDMVFHSKFDQKELDRERGVIIEEINMYQDSPMRHVEDLLEEVVFEGNTLGWEIAGSHKTMKEMKRDEIIAFRDAHYVPSRMVVSVAGNIPKDIRKILEKTFGSVKPSKAEHPTFEPFVRGNAKKKVNVQFKKTEQIHLMFGFPSFGIGDDRNETLALLSCILGGTMSSRLFISVRERKGLAYMVRSSNTAYDDAGVFSVQAGLDKSRVPLAYKTIMQELRKIKRDGVTAKEVKEAIDHVRGSMLLAMESSSFQAEWYGDDELFLNKVRTPEQFMDTLAKITAADIKKIANEVINEKQMKLAVIGPYKNEEAFLKSIA